MSVLLAWHAWCKAVQHAQRTFQTSCGPRWRGLRGLRECQHLLLQLRDLAKQQRLPGNHPHANASTVMTTRRKETKQQTQAHGLYPLRSWARCWWHYLGCHQLRHQALRSGQLPSRPPTVLPRHVRSWRQAYGSGYGNNRDAPRGLRQTARRAHQQHGSTRGTNTCRHWWCAINVSSKK